MTSGDEEEEDAEMDTTAGGGRRGSDNRADDDDDGYMPHIERIRSEMMGRSAASAASSVKQHRSPSAAPIPRAFPAPSLSSVAAGSNASAAAAEEEKTPQITIKLKMVFDPTRNVPEVAKRAYERPESFTIGLVS